MATKLIIDGNTVYEIDEDCLERQKKKGGYREMRTGKGFWNLEQKDYSQIAEEDS